MRAFSQSQGKFVDVPDSPQQAGADAFSGATQPQSASPITPGAIPGQDASSTTSLGIPDQTVRNMFFQIGLSNPKSISSLNSLYGFIKPQAPSAAQQKATKAKEDFDKAATQTNNTIGNLLTQYQSLSDIEKSPGIGALATKIPFSGAHTYDQQRKGLYAALKDIAGAGYGSGVRINNYDIKLWADLLPAPGDTPTQVKTKIKSLDTQIKAKFGQGLDPEYLDAFGVAPKGSDQGGTSGGGYNFNITNVHK